MTEILLAWIGAADLKACCEDSDTRPGPIATVTDECSFERVVLLCNYEKERGEAYKTWLMSRALVPVETFFCSLPSPTHYRSIYEKALTLTKSMPEDRKLVFHLSPGTPAMATVWILIAQTYYPGRARLIQSSPECGLENVDLPFDIYAEFGPELLRHSDDELVRLTQGLPTEAVEFDHIIHRCEPMQRAVAMARRLALRDIPVLILGESGTGKELMAVAIHRASQRAQKPFKSLNCGALAGDIIDSELFGYRKNAFTGAETDHEGLFEAADGGILFLDEIGELSDAAQVRLLRTLQEGTIRRVGDTHERKVDVRIVAATHRDLLTEAANGEFREDLFYRLAVGLIHLPPLREREGDLGKLIDHLLSQINEEAATSQRAYVPKKISPDARSLARHQPWPGNVRELRNVLVRASIWASGDTITHDDLQRSLFAHPVSRQSLLHRPFDDDFKLDELDAEFQKLYIDRALTQTGNNKAQAAKLLGFKSHQALDARIKSISKKHR